MFDPYHKWLGIRKELQPPTLYQLLGISPDEKDPEVIEEAAIRQTTHVRTYQIGPHAAACTRLLNEIAQARLTLLSPAKRQAYDAGLQAEAAPMEAPPFWPSEDAPSSPDKEEGELMPISTLPVSGPSRNKRKWVMGAVIGGACHLIAGAILIWFLFLKPKNKDELNPADDKPAVAHQDPNRGPNPARLNGQSNRQTKLDMRPDTRRDTKKGPIKISPEPVDIAIPPPSREIPLAPRELRRFDKQPEAILLVAFFGDGKRAVWVGRNGNMVVIDLETGQEMGRFASIANNIRVMALTPDGKRLLYENAGRNMVLVDTETGAEIRQFDRHTHFADSMAISPDGNKALTTAGPFTRLVTLWNMETGQKVRELKPNAEGGARNSSGKHMVAFSPEGRRFLVTFGDNILRLWDLFTGTEIRRFEGEIPGVNCLAFSPNGKHAVSGHFDRSLRLWEVSTGTEVGRFEGHHGSVMSVAFSPNGLHLLSGSSDRTVRLWEVATRKEVVQLSAHMDTVNCVVFAPDGRRGLSGSFDKSVRLWELPISADIATKPAEIDLETEKAGNVAGQEKLSVPDQTALANAKQEIRAKYKGKFALTKPGEKLNLAEELFHFGNNTEQPAERYMAYMEGIELAVQVGNVAMAISAVDALGKGFVIEPLEMKVAALEKIGKTAGEVGSRTVTDSALNLANEAMDADNYAMADRCMALAVAAAKTAKSPAVDKKVESRAKELDEARDNYQKVEKALATLKDKPQDPDANLTVGKHYCFRRGDWKKGLAMLALSGDGKIRDLAKKDLGQIKDAKVQVEVADGWWDLAEKETGKTKTTLLRRARYWYEEAEGTAEGIAKTRVDDRLKEMDKLLPSGPQVKPGSFYARFGPLKTQLLRDGGGNEKSEAAVAAGLKWIVRHQAKDGRWSLNNFHLHVAGCTCTGAGNNNNDIAGTALALLPLLGAGETHKRGPYAKNVEKGLQFLLARQNRIGYFGGDMYAHAIATMAVCEAYGLTGDSPLRKPAIAALNYILAAQSDNGGWRYFPRQGGDTSVTGWQVMALKTGLMAGFKVPSKTFTEAGRWLDSCMFNDGGGYGYLTSNDGTPATSAIGLLLRQYLGWEYRHAGLKAGVNRLKSIPPELSNNQYYNYYATQVLYHMGGEAWDFWNPLMRDLLIKTQDKGDPRNPHQAGSWDPKGDAYAFNGGRLMITSLALLNLEIYYRYVPLYRRGTMVMKD